MARLCRWLPAGGLQCPELMPTPPSIIQLGGVVRPACSAELSGFADIRGAWS
jgi:hypothetical protein